MQAKENKDPFDFTNEPLAGWDDQTDILGEKNLNIRPPTNIFKTFQHQKKARVNNIKSEKRQPSRTSNQFPIR